MKKVACVIFELEKGETVENVISRVESTTGKNVVPAKDAWRIKLEELLNRLSIGTTYKGYHCIMLMMEMLASNPKSREHIYLSELKDYAYEKGGISHERADRNLRAMIDVIYKKNDMDIINESLNITNPCERINKPIVSRFVSLVAQKIF